MYVQRNIEAPSRNHYSRGKAKLLHILNVRLQSQLSSMQKCMRRIIQPIPVLPYFFFTLSHKLHNFRETLMDVQCFFLFTLQLLSEAVLGACKIAKSDFQFRHVCPSIRSHRTTRFPLNEFSRNLIFEYFSKICRKNSSFIKVLQE